MGRSCSRESLGVRHTLPSLLLASTMLTGGAAWAQTAPAKSEPTVVEEVIVTAQKRSENLQKVPMSVQALGTQKLDQLQVADFQDFAKFLPSVSYQTAAPGFDQIYMRGVSAGGRGNHSGSLPTVGVYLDEQPVTTIQGPLDIHVYDIARVESLAGPQGTLYGASSEAGTIRIITNKPSLAGFSAGYDLETNKVAHGDAGWSAEGFVNIPVHDRAAVRLVGWRTHDGGYIDNVPGSVTFPTSGVTMTNADRVKDNYNDVDTVGARAALKIDLDDNWTVTPTFMAQNEKVNGNFAYDPQVGDLKISHFFPERSRDVWHQAALTVEGKIGNFDLVYAGALMKRKVEYEQDYTDYGYFYDVCCQYGSYFVDDGGDYINPAQFIRATDRYKKESHELRLTSPKDQRLRALVGLFYERQQHDIQQRYMVNDLAAGLEVPGWSDTIWLTKQLRTDRDYAIFGELSYDVTDKLSVTGGLRLFKADNSLQGFFGFSDNYSGSTGVAACFAPPLDALPSSPCTNVNKEIEETGKTWRLNATYQIDPRRMVYATVATGFRPGGINRRGTLPPYKSDYLTSYEAGWKTSWFDGRLRWNGAVFLEKWKDFQFAILGANGLTEIRNAGQARIMGAETDWNWRPADGWSVFGSASYTDGKLTEDYCGYLNGDTGQPETHCPNADVPLPPQAPKGTELPVTAKFKANIAARYEFMLGDYNAHVQGAYAFQTGSWADMRVNQPFGDNPATPGLPYLFNVREILGKQKGYGTADFTAGLARDNWTVELFVKNAFDVRGDVTRYAECAEPVCGSSGVPGGPGRIYVVPNRPRLIGVRFGQKF
jgi:outer membrane receptor protein involved in Fe transport